MDSLRPLIEDCCGWNRLIWADALEFAISRLPGPISAKKILEIGAGKYSAIAPIFAKLGAKVVCSYYKQSREDILGGQLGFVCRKHSLNDIPLVELDINDLDSMYDIVVMKSVMGGICRRGDYRQLRVVVDNVMRHIGSGGAILTVDNGYIGIFDRLRRVLGAGKNEWTYLERDRVLSALSGYDVEIAGFGFLNFGSARFALQHNMEFANDVIYFVDRAVLRLLKAEGRAILAAVITRKNDGTPVGGLAEVPG
jgi:hypothetical protein